MRIKKILLALATVASLTCGSSHANLIVNGDFEQTSNGIGQFDSFTTLNGWSSNGYNFVFASNTADSSGSPGAYGNLPLWGPQNGSANGLGASPTGGNFIGANANFLVSPIQQMIYGLIVGHQYDLSFYWGAAQQFGFDGTTSSKWIVALGDELRETATVHIPSHGFSGWMNQKFSFVANGTTRLLTFLAEGTPPSGAPPFALLDGVTLQEHVNVPEPTTWTMLLAGFGLMLFALRRGKHSAI